MRLVLQILFAFLLLVASLGACSSAEETVAVEVVGYNHTDKYIHMFTVNEGGGGNAFAHSGGGKFVCCVAVPKYGNERIGNFNVHFLRGGTVKVFVTTYSLWHPAYPLKGKEAEL